jgi:hypothetical protein
LLGGHTKVCYRGHESLLGGHTKVCYRAYEGLLSGVQRFVIGGTKVCYRGYKGSLRDYKGLLWASQRFVIGLTKVCYRGYKSSLRDHKGLLSGLRKFVIGGTKVCYRGYKGSLRDYKGLLWASQRFVIGLTKAVMGVTKVGLWLHYKRGQYCPILAAAGLVCDEATKNHHPPRDHLCDSHTPVFGHPKHLRPSLATCPLVFKHFWTGRVQFLRVEIWNLGGTLPKTRYSGHL